MCERKKRKYVKYIYSLYPFQLKTTTKSGKENQLAFLFVIQYDLIQYQCFDIEIAYLIVTGADSSAVEHLVHF